jgi:hypothetical protein
MNPRIAVALAAAITASCLAQTTRLVPSQYPTIQGAINASAPADTVLVSPGTYTQNINFSGKAITVVSSQGPLVTTIQGNGATRVVSFVSGEGPSSTLNGFTITGGVGGILCQNTSPTILNCTVQGNNAPSEGGGGIRVLATTGTASPSITGCRLTANVAQNGGGFCAESQTASAICIPTLTSTEVSSNFCPGGSGLYGGGGLDFHRSGGVLAPVLDGCSIDSNTNQTGYGGGVSFYDTNTVLVRRCRITNNTSYASNQVGGGVAIACYSSPSPQVTLSGCVLAGNTASAGGGIYAGPGGSLLTTVTLTNCTIFKNSAAQGPAIATYNAVFSMTNSILWGHLGYPISIPPTGTLLVTYSDVQNSLYSSNATNRSSDPLFVDPLNGDFHLASNSPCVNTGSNGAAGLATLDLDGTPRIQGGTVDMGSDEVPILAYPGTADGLDVYAWVNGAGDPLASTRAAATGAHVTVKLASSNGILVGGVPVVAAELYVNGSPPSPAPPAVWLDGLATIIYGSLAPAPPFSVPGLPASGLTFSFVVPAGLSGHTVRFQGAVTSVDALNGMFAVSNATEVSF